MKVLQSLRIGVFNIVEVEDENGKKAVGISRRSKYDKRNDVLGETIARGRAIKALNKKLKKREIRNHYMG